MMPRPAMGAAPRESRQNRLPLVALLTANAISQTGNYIAAIAIPWFVLQTTGSAAKTGISGFFAILPIVLAGFFGGVIVDRLGYRRTSILADLASGLAVLLIPLLYFTLGLEFWQLLVLVFLGAFLDTPGASAREAMLPELASLTNLSLERATSLSQIVERGARLAGAALAGGLIALVGTAHALWVDAATFGVSAAIVAAFVRPQVHAQRPPEAHYWRELAEGLRFLRNDALLLTIVVTVMVINGLDAAFGGVVQPVYVKALYGSALDLGLLVSMNGGGAVVGALIFAAVGHRFSRRLVFLAGFLLVSARYWAYLTYPSLAVLMLATFVTSIGAGPLNPIIDAVRFERIPPGMRGRVFGTIQAGAWSAMPLGVLLGGFLTERFGLQAMLIALGGTYLLVTSSLAFLPAIRDVERGSLRVAERKADSSP